VISILHHVFLPLSLASLATHTHTHCLCLAWFECGPRVSVHRVCTSDTYSFLCDASPPLLFLPPRTLIHLVREKNAPWSLAVGDISASSWRLHTEMLTLHHHIHHPTPPHPIPSHRMGCRISRTAVASVGGPPPFVPETAPTDLGETKKTTLLKAINDALDIVLVGHRPSFSTLFDCLHTHSLSPASLMRLELRLFWCLGQSRPLDAMILGSSALATLFSTAHAAVVGPGQCRCTGWVRWLGEPGLASGTVSLWI
jgi:hypothetical protein